MVIDPVFLAKELVSFPSVTPSDNGAIDFVKNILNSLGFCSKVLLFGDKNIKIRNLYSQLGSKSPNLCFAGHTDVVTPGDKSKWLCPPFSPQIIDGVLYGRGVVDMKASICAFISAVSEIKRSDIKGSISFLITGDEEGENYHYGTKEVLKWLSKEGKKIDYCIVGEPTSDKKLGDTVKIGRRGSMTFKLQCHGTQGHVAYPDFADNPIDNMINILYKINKTVFDKGNEYFQPSNCEIITIDVDNDNNNVIPDLITAKFNIRYNTEHSAESLIKVIDNICCSITKKYNLHSSVSAEAFLNNPDEHTAILSSIINHHTGEDVKLTTSGGTSDARFIKDFCPVVEFGLLNKTAHKINENSSIADIYKLTSIYRDFINKFFDI